MLSALPKAQQKRVRATRFLEEQCQDIDKELEEKIFELTQSFQPRYNALRAKRAEIIKGEYEPTERPPSSTRKMKMMTILLGLKKSGTMMRPRRKRRRMTRRVFPPFGCRCLRMQILGLRKPTWSS